MMVRLLKPWKWNKVGRVFNDMPDGLANLLIRSGVGEIVQPEKKEKPAQQPKVKRVPVGTHAD